MRKKKLGVASALQSRKKLGPAPNYHDNNTHTEAAAAGANPSERVQKPFLGPSFDLVHIS
jgi:hypothetical protein